MFINVVNPMAETYLPFELIWGQFLQRSYGIIGHAVFIIWLTMISHILLLAASLLLTKMIRREII
jgi:hypothetical protein